MANLLKNLKFLSFTRLTEINFAVKKLPKSPPSLDKQLSISYIFQTV